MAVTPTPHAHFLRPSWRWASLPFLLVAWCLAASRVPSYVLPQPWSVAAEGWHWLLSGDLGQQVLASLLREFGGFGASAASDEHQGRYGGGSPATGTFVDATRRSAAATSERGLLATAK